jgi:Flp pilus assembly protein TadD
MLIRRKRHWATLLAIGLPLVVGGCAGSGMPTPAGSPPTQATAATTNPFALAERLRAEGNVSSAVSMYQQAHQANPGDIRPLLGLGDCLLAISANADAAQAYGSALQIDPNNLEALRGLGHARILLGQPQFAVTQYQAAVKLAPQDVRSLNGLGVAQDMVGDHAAAQATYKRVLAIDPSNQSAKNNLGLSLALSGDSAGAIKILEDLSKSAGSSTVNRQNLALVYGVSGQLDQARQVSRADLPADAVDRNIAAMSANSDAAARQQLLQRSLGVELKGRQYAAAAKPIMPLGNLAQASVNDEPVYLSGTEGSSMPVITTGKETRVATAAAASTEVKTFAKRSTGDDWADDWDEELVDATDYEGGTGQQTAALASQSANAASMPPQTSKPSPFLSSSKAIADDKAPTAAPIEAKAPPAALVQPKTETAAATPAAPAIPKEPEKPAAATAVEAAPSAPAAMTASAGTTPAVTATQIATAKIYTVQLASYRSEAEATAGWQTLTTEQQDLLAKLPHAVAKADLGTDKGIYYRLQAGTFTDRQAAKALCSDLQTRSIDCMVVEAAPPESAAPTKTQQSMLAPDRSFVIGAR